MGNRKAKTGSKPRRKRNKQAVAYGHLTNKIGSALEMRVVKALEKYKLPGWKVVRKGSDKEDAAGFDVVIELDAGWLGIQVKSSTNGKESFLHDRGHPAIPIVIIDMSDSDEEIRVKVLKELRVLFCGSS